MEKIHNFIFCTHCGQKLTGFEGSCPSCSFRLAETPIPQNEIPQPVKIDDHKPSEVYLNPPFYPEKIKKKIKKKGIGVIWLILIIISCLLLLGAGSIAFLHYNRNITVAFLDKFIPKKDAVQFKEIVTSDQNNKTKTQSNTSSKQDTIKHVKQEQQENEMESTVLPSENNSGDNDKFFIIAGSYSTEQEAQQAVGTLKSKGFSKARIVGQNETGKWRICYNAFPTRQNATEELGIIRQDENPSAWIFERK